MKQNGVRLVQRKFAQGVPIPTSANSVAPLLPPERKAEPIYPANFYQSNMSARSLLDIVSLQNVHKHKPEPLVVLERLRDDEMPAQPAPEVRLRIQTRRGQADKEMCLRSGKRKPDAVKRCTQKRKKMSSESTDDVPLMYYFDKSKLDTNHKPKAKKERSLGKAAKRKEKTGKTVSEPEDKSFTFKEPRTPMRLSSRLLKKQAAAVKGRAARKSRLAMSARLSNLRSSRASSDSATEPLGTKQPKAAVRKRSKTICKDDRSLSVPGPSCSRATTPPTVDDRSLSVPGPSCSRATTPPTVDDRSLSVPGPSCSRATTPPTVDDRLLSVNGPSSLRVPTPPTVGSNSPSESLLTVFRNLGDAVPSSPASTLVLGTISPTLSFDFEPESESGIPDLYIDETASEPPQTNRPVKLEQDSITEDTIKKENDNMEAEKCQPRAAMILVAGTIWDDSPKTQRKAASPKKSKKTKPMRGAKTAPEETPGPSTRLMRNSRERQPPNPDVYEFNAELEASRPPSSLRRRGLATPDPAPSAPPTPDTAPPAPPTPGPRSPESAEYVDIQDSSHCIKIHDDSELGDPDNHEQITPTKEQDTGRECVSVSLVPKQEINMNKKNLLENLSNSPALLNKFFNCLTAEMKHELDNLITAEGLNEQPSTSGANSASSNCLDDKAGTVFEAPIFRPTAEEFADPIKYFESVAPQVSRYGLCKIVPPEGFQPPCYMNDTLRFAVIHQYISKMYNRWGPVSRELAAIKAHLRTQSVVFARSPLIYGSEVNITKLYHAVERNGGISNVIRRKRWGRVAEELKLTKIPYPDKKLDHVYMRYLLPYATLSNQERQNIMANVERCWTKKYQQMLERAQNPFQRQHRMLGVEQEAQSDSDDEGYDNNTSRALQEAEDCIVKGRTMNLAMFKKIATALMDAHFEPHKQPPSASDVEKAYWRAVLLGTEHIVPNTASIDTGEEGFGFPKDPDAEYGTHPWNLKVLARNPGNVLRYLGAVLGVTVPTLHMNMLFSTSCWHRDPHGLPWIEYMHSGAEKIWYGIPRDESANFRRAVETLCPAFCQNKSIWLASEITMVPPNILSEHGVKLSRVLQRPGEYVLVFPEAHTCSITTGFGISESVYFASGAWLCEVYKLFQELRNSCEPTMFSLEQLLLAGSADPAAPQQVCSVLCTLLGAELEHRRALEHKGLKVQERPGPSAPLNPSNSRTWNSGEQEECEYCRSTLFLSKVTGLTGRKSGVCPEHALRLLETKKYKNIDMSSLELISSYSTNALEEMLERLERSISEEIRAPSVIDLTGPEVDR